LRGKVAVQPLWIIGPSLFIATVISLSHFNGQRFTTPLRGVISMFVIWRIALWLVACAGLWYNVPFFSFANALTTDGHLTDHNDLLMRGLVNFWTYWDGAHYRSIASYGYTFRGVQWPTIAFFPLYPALIRFLLPLTAGNVSIVAVIVSNVALLIALLL